MPLPSCSVYNYELEVVIEINSNTYGPLYPDEDTCPPAQVRDCFGLCKHHSNNNFGYITVCGCNTGGTCPQTCSGQGGVGIPYSTSNYWSVFPSPPAPLSIPYPNPDLYYCNTVLECPIVSGCTNPDASNYNSNASVDDGSCTFSTDPEEPEPIDSIMYKPSIERIWTFTANGSVISDPTPGQQIDNFDEEISTGVFDISNIYYVEIENDAYDENNKIFAFINNQLRGYANITEQGYYYLEVKWKQQLELEEIITFYLKHNGQIKLIDEIITHNNELVDNSYTSDFIYSVE